MTIKEATELWVNRDMTAVPKSVVEKLFRLSNDLDIIEITPPTKYNRVEVYGTSGGGEITACSKSGDDYIYEIKTDGGETVALKADSFDVCYDDWLPMWGTLWSFDNSLDRVWLEDPDNLQKMANCGFRIYESEDYGYLFGIDGAGYDFYEAHWIPLYKARGLKWHATNC